MTPQPRAEWEKEFDEKFKTFGGHLHIRLRGEHEGLTGRTVTKQDIKSFISRLLSSEYERGKEEAIHVKCPHGLLLILCGICANPLQQAVQESLSRYRESIEKNRGAIEKIVWRHYDPDRAPNVEEITDEILHAIKELPME